MKAGWEEKPLSELCEIRPNKKLAKADLGDTDKVSFVGMSELGELRSEFEHREVRELRKVYSGYTYFANRDVIVAKITPCFENGKMGIASNLTNGVGFGSSEFVPLRSKGEITPEFLFYFLMRDEFREDGARVMSGAVGHKRVPKDYLEDLPIPLPPLEEQKRIVAVLDAAFEGLDRARAHVEANLQNARDLFESYLGSVFEGGTSNWVKGSVREAMDKGVISKPIDGNHGGTHPVKADFRDKGVPFIMASDLKEGVVDQENCYFLDRDQADNLRKGFAEDGDILLSHKGTIGRVAELHSKLDYVMLTPQVTYYRSEDHSVLTPKFIYYFFLSSTFQHAINKSAKDGATRAYIGITKQQQLPFYYPPLLEQEAYIKKFEKVESASKNTVSYYQSKLTDLDDLRQSLLQKAFAGELT